MPGDGTSRIWTAIVSKSSDITLLLRVRENCASFTCIASWKGPFTHGFGLFCIVNRSNEFI